jgi:CHRD domain
MSASAKQRSPFRGAPTGRGKRPHLTALALVALISGGSYAFALKIPLQASLNGGGEVPSNNSPAKGLMQGTFDTDTNTLEWTVTYSGLATEPIGAHFHGPVSYLGLTPGGERAHSGRNPGQSGKPVPRGG